MTGDPAALSVFSALPLLERLFVRARLRSAPLERIAARLPPGRIADVGCGHGLLVALLAVGHPERSVVGVDPDERKIRWARAAVGALPNVSLRVGAIEQLGLEEDGTLDALVVCDVLYLLPPARWAAFLSAALRLLRPGGVLMLKEAEADGSWKHWKCLWQERVMVLLLRRTRRSGGLGFRPRAFTEALLRHAGFRLRETASLAAGYSTPHVLFVAERPGEPTPAGAPVAGRDSAP